MVNNKLNAKVGAPMDLLVISGMKLEMGCVLTDVEGSPISLIDVEELKFTVKHCSLDNGTAWLLSLGNGLSIIGDDMNVINFNATVPVDLPAGVYAYDLVYRNASGWYTLFYGDGKASSFIVQQNISDVD